MTDQYRIVREDTYDHFGELYETVFVVEKACRNLNLSGGGPISNRTRWKPCRIWWGGRLTFSMYTYAQEYIQGLLTNAPRSKTIRTIVSTVVSKEVV